LALTVLPWTMPKCWVTVLPGTVSSVDTIMSAHLMMDLPTTPRYARKERSSPIHRAKSERSG
jgi:hypothetical protein